MKRTACVTAAILACVVTFSVWADLQNAQVDEKTVVPGEITWSASPFKPYVQELYTPLGIEFLRDQVPDHIHHHGLMFAVFVDGVDFWSETEKCGHEKLRSADERIPAKDNVLPGINLVCGLRQNLVWTGEKPLLDEQRTTKLLRIKEPSVNLLIWQSTLSAPEGKPSSSLTGSHYTGLGMRFPQSMDIVAKFFNSEGVEGEIVRGDERNFVAKWNAATGPIDGKPVTIVMFGHPDNVRPTTWFTMAKGFAYQSATLNLHKEPLTVEAGKPITLKYGVAAFDGLQSPEAIGKIYDQFLKLTTNN